MSLKAWDCMDEPRQTTATSPMSWGLRSHQIGHIDGYGHVVVNPHGLTIVRLHRSVPVISGATGLMDPFNDQYEPSSSSVCVRG